MEGHPWERSSTKEEDAQEVTCIKEDVPSVVCQESRLKFRSFCSADDERWGNRLDDSEFRIFKRRRFDSALDCHIKRGCEEMHMEPLLHRLVDSFEVSQRQYQTLQWIRFRNPSKEKIYARFALDRSLGVPPSLSCVHRILRAFDQCSLSSQHEDNIPLIVHLLEDLVLDGIDISVLSVVKIVHCLLSQPVFAAGVAFMLKSAMKQSLDSLPVAMWAELCLSLAENSRNYLSLYNGRLVEDFVQLFSKVLEQVRAGGESVGETAFAAFGLGLLLHPQHILRVIALASQEIFSGKNKKDSHENPSIISAFLSKLVCVSCEIELSNTRACLSSSTGKSKKKQVAAECSLSIPSEHTFLDFMGEVVRFACSRNIQLSSTAFDALLELCDTTHEYFPLCIFFSASCVLSIPTLRSFLRFVEVLHDFRQQLKNAGIQNVLNGSCSSFLLWFFRKYGEDMWNYAHSPRLVREPVLLHIFDLAGKIMCLEGEPSTVAQLFFSLRRYAGVHRAFLPIVSYYLLWRRSAASTASHSSEVNEVVSAFDALSVNTVSALFDVPSEISPRDQLSVDSDYYYLRERSDEERDNNSSVILLRKAVKNFISDPQMYCNILTTQCINVLGENDEYRMAFVRMMSDYRSRAGAVVILPLDNFLPNTSGVTVAGRKLALKWYREEHEWFVILPLSLSAQLGGQTPLCVSFDLFRFIQIEHKRVMFIGGSADEIQLAAQQNLQPVISVMDLMKKLIRK